MGLLIKWLLICRDPKLGVSEWNWLIELLGSYCQ